MVFHLLYINQMDSLTIAAAAGTRARLETLDIIANNIANSNTVGFKADRDFYGVYQSVSASLSSSEGRPLPTDIPETGYHVTDYSQGQLTNTSNPLDLAIEGNGFFEVTRPTGTHWTRAGTFKIGPSGRLETHDGDLLTVTSPPGKEFKLDPNLPIKIDRSGEITQGDQVQGTIELKLPAGDRYQLEKQGNTYFKAEALSSRALGGSTVVHQGSLEAANFSVADAAVRLVTVMRQFEMLQKAITLGSDMNRKVIEETGRVNS